MAHLAAQIILPVIIAMLYLLGAAVQAALLRVSTPASCSTRGRAPPEESVPQPVTRAGVFSWLMPGAGRHTGDTAGVSATSWTSCTTATS